MKRRAFFQAVAKAAAIVALAPRIAFRVPNESFGGVRFTESMIGVREQLRRSAQHPDFLVGSEQRLDFQDFLNKCYAVKCQRESRGNDHFLTR